MSISTSLVEVDGRSLVFILGVVGLFFFSLASQGNAAVVGLVTWTAASALPPS